MADYTVLAMFMVFCLSLTLVALTAINANKDKVANKAITWQFSEGGFESAPRQLKKVRRRKQRANTKIRFVQG